MQRITRAITLDNARIRKRPWLNPATLSCEGKARFATAKSAKRKAKSRGRSGRSRPYLCAHCRWFHLGSSL